MTQDLERNEGGLPVRELGKTGLKVSIIGFGGGHCVRPDLDEQTTVRLVQMAIDAGVTFMDNAWEYHQGESERRMGLALKGRRDQVTLMTKVCGRDRKTAEAQLHESLRRLQTDVIDVWQFHEINYDNDPDWIVERGALSEVLKAQKAGKIRYIGFTGHKDPRIHLSMLGRHSWDTVQMPVNACDPHYRSFIKQVIPQANKKGIGVIGMKSLGGGNSGKGRFVVEKVCSAEEARHFALTQEIAALVVGIDSMDILRQDLRIGRTFKPMTEAAQNKLLAKVKGVAGDGRHERFKSTQLFDGPYHRQQHGLTEEDVQGT
jgi:predicted aldo/keto reductase-like oxidoreductase